MGLRSTSGAMRTLGASLPAQLGQLALVVLLPACGGRGALNEVAADRDAGGDAEADDGVVRVDPHGLSCSETTVLGSSTFETRDPIVLASDDDIVVFWARSYCECAPGEAGLFAARPGSEAARVSDREGAWVTGTAVENGWLLCWNGCAIVGPDFNLASEPWPSDSGYFYPRIGGQLYRLAYVASSRTHTLTPVDEAGSIAGAPVALPCAPSAWNDEHLACADVRDTDCGTQWEEPEDDCMMRFHLIDPDGEAFSDEVDVARAPGYGAAGRFELAAARDSYAMTWTEREVHVQFFDATGAPGGRVDVVDPESTTSWAKVAAVDPNFVVYWTAPMPGSFDSRLRFAVIAPDGNVLRGPEWIDADAAENWQPAGWASVAPTPDGWAIAWAASRGSNSTYESTVRLRLFGCSEP